MSFKRRKINNIKFNNDILRDINDKPCSTCAYNDKNGYCGAFDMVMGTNRLNCEYYIKKDKQCKK